MDGTSCTTALTMAALALKASTSSGFTGGIAYSFERR